MPTYFLKDDLQQKTVSTHFFGFYLKCFTQFCCFGFGYKIINLLIRQPAPQKHILEKTGY